MKSNIIKIIRWAYVISFIAGLLLVFNSCKKPRFEAAPPVGSIGTINSYLANNFDLSLFAAAVQKAGLADSLDLSASAFTVWAPLNSAFNKEGIFSPADFDKWPPDSLRYLVRSHIMPGKLFYQNIPSISDNRYKNVNGVDLYVSKQQYNAITLIVDGVPVLPAGQLGSGASQNFGITQLNGVIYPITSPIKVFKGTVQDFLSSRADLSVLTAGIKKFGLWDNLKGDGPFTVVAPQDSAFATYGLTKNSLTSINTSQYDPALFGAYFVKPNHVYPLDIFQLVQGSAYYGLNTTVSDYKLIMNVVTNQAYYYSVLLAKGNVTVSTADKILGPVNPGDLFPKGSVFLGEVVPDGSPVDTDHPPYGRYINYSCSNGLVHLLSKVLVTPSELKK